MSNPGEEDATPIEDVKQLADSLAAGGKPRARWRIGTEHEKFGFSRRTLLPPPYEQSGIRAVLEGLAPLGWDRIEDDGRLIGLGQEGRSISLEPGGQLELSGAPVVDLHDTAREMSAHFGELREATDPIFVGFAPLGFHPLARLVDIPMMPKTRYGIMKRYMPKVGANGLDMMFRTCTVQVNLDFADERDMVRKMRLASVLQPLATALFANSPFTEGKPNGFQSYRAQVWTDVDRARSGIPAVIFSDAFGFAAYAEWLLDVPMYFVMRGGRMFDAAGASFRKWIGGGEPALAHLRPTMGDWADHVTTAFPDVRLKRFIEMRGADAGSAPMMLAQSALWVGLLYDEGALADAEAFVRRTAPDWRDWVRLRERVPREGLDAWLGDRSLRAVARELVAIARAGRVARGRDEAAFLDPLAAIAEGAPTQAEFWLGRNRDVWKGEVGRIFTEAAI